MNYVNPERRPYPFCPGCTHGTILDAIDSALEKTGADPKRTVLVSDIGCVGLADKYFDVHTFHGLHGRSFTYACGIKLANPKLNVLTLVGDGGCGIGGHHLINAARRNIGIKVICSNNFNFGMTGGEHSVTTPLGGKTHTTPLGNIERPFDLCNLVLSAGGAFVARQTAFDKGLSDTLAQAFSSEGFAFIDILEICTAYYMPLNDFKKSALVKFVEDGELKLGVLGDNKLPEYAREIRTAWSVERQPPPPPRPIEKKFGASLEKESYSIMCAGSAGQKIVSSASNLAVAGLSCGLFASQEDDYPVTVQTGHSVSDVQLSRGEIYYPCADKPDALLITSADGLRMAKKTLDLVDEKSVVIADAALSEIQTKARVLRANLSDRATGLSKETAMTAAISWLLHIEKIIPPEAFRNVLNSISKETIRDLNLKAFGAGAEFAK